MIKIAILEVGNEDRPVVGVIVGDNQESLENSLTLAIESHFDAYLKDVKYKWNGSILELGTLPSGKALISLKGGGEYEIQLVRTWIYYQ